jgi:[ribosomal protein S5]-alanine N-acetyltransferase
MSTMTTLETERLIIRNFQASDWQDLYVIIVQYQASEFAPYDQPWPTSREEIKRIVEWFASGDSFLAVCLKDTNQLIGFVGLNPEEGNCQREFNLGYVFSSDFHGRGYATEACTAVLSRAFGQLQADRVVTGTAAVNQASCRLLERLGFQKNGEKIVSFKTAEDEKPIEFLGYRYAISRDDWGKRLLAH